ncbi:tetratricopeptide repeat protein, partial [Methylorubrum extorquens]|uniref:tetratricopeptide repeat protein n=1 Tax=Methylorubrum extorquens TaxID=408 RepID=UPI001AEDEBCE
QPSTPAAVRAGNVPERASEQIAALPPVGSAPVVAPSPATNPRREDLIAACDRLAGRLGDADLPADMSGVNFNKIDVKAAIPACQAAVEALRAEQGWVAERRLYFQLGRALDADNQYIKAKTQYEQSVALGSAAGMSSVGNLYKNGKGVMQDYKAAHGWYEKAAEKGELTAMTNLGIMHENGEGVPVNPGAALRWYEKAAERGLPIAMTYLGNLYEHGRGVAEDYAAARLWYEKAADKGLPTAMTKLGKLYENGRGVAENHAVARRWYEKAKAAGDMDAASYLAELTAAERRSSGAAKKSRPRR